MEFAHKSLYRAISPGRIVSGAGSLSEVPRLVDRVAHEAGKGARESNRIVVATSKSVAGKTPLVQQVCERLDLDDRHVFSGCRQHSPEADIDSLLDMIRQSDCSCVVSIG